MIATNLLCTVFRRPSTVYNRTPNWNNKERKGSAVLLDALVINKSQSAAIVLSDTGQVATIVVQQPSLSANSPEHGHEGCHTAPVELPIDFNRWPDFANSLSSQQYHDFQMKWVYFYLRYFTFSGVWLLPVNSILRRSPASSILTPYIRTEWLRKIDRHVVAKIDYF